MGAKLYDTITGEITELNAKYEEGKTVIEYTSIPMTACCCTCSRAPAHIGPPFGQTRSCRRHKKGFISKVPVELSEPNVLLLDIAEYSLDGGSTA